MGKQIWEFATECYLEPRRIFPDGGKYFHCSGFKYSTRGDVNVPRVTAVEFGEDYL